MSALFANLDHLAEQGPGKEIQQIIGMHYVELWRVFHIPQGMLVWRGSSSSFQLVGLQTEAQTCTKWAQGNEYSALSLGQDTSDFCQLQNRQPLAQHGVTATNRWFLI